MAEKIVTVIAQMKAKEGLEEKVKAELLSLIAPTLSEAGCSRYELYQSPDNPLQFMFYETWKSRQDLDAHLGKPYIQAFMKKAVEHLAEPVRVSLWEKVG